MPVWRVAPSLVIAGMALMLGGATGAAEPAHAPESYTLSQCAIVQTGDQPRVYLTSESGRLEAVEVPSGRTIWRTAKAAFPLMARGTRVLVSMPPAAKGNGGCGLAILDARSGAFLGAVPWPLAGSPGCVGEGISGSSHTSGFALEGRDYVRWESKWWPTPGGAYRGPHDSYPPGSYGEVHGVAEVDLLHAAVSPAASELMDSLPMLSSRTAGSAFTATFMVDGVAIQAARTMAGNRVHLLLHRWKDGAPLPEISLGDPPWNSSGFQVTADRRHVLGVWQVPGAANPIRYHTEIYAATTGARVGVIEPTSWPVVSQLCGAILVAYVPSRVFAFELASGREVWSRTVKDLTYRGPYPPSARPPAKGSPE